MAVYNVIRSSSLQRESKLVAEFYQKERTDTETELKQISKNRIRDIFTERKDVIKPSEITENHRVFDLGDSLNQILKYSTNLESPDYCSVKKRAFEGDFIISRLRSYLKEMAVVPRSDHITALSTEYLVFYSDTNIPAKLLLPFSLTSHVQRILKWSQTGNEHPRFDVSAYKNIYIPCVLEDKNLEICSLVDTMISEYEKAEQIINNAIKIVGEELHIAPPKADDSVFIVSASETIKARRLDSDFHHPKYTPIIESILNYKYGTSPLAKISTQHLSNFNRRNHTESVDYIEIGDIDVYNGAYTFNSIGINDLPANAKVTLSGGELLISKVRPTRGAITLITRNLTGTTVASGAFYVCSVDNVHYREIVWIYLRLMTTLFEKYCTGTSYPTIDSSYISELPIPNFSPKLARHIHDEVNKAIQLRNSAQTELTKSVQYVEKLIREATHNASK